MERKVIFVNLHRRLSHPSILARRPESEMRRFTKVKTSLLVRTNQLKYFAGLPSDHPASVLCVVWTVEGPCDS